MGTMIDRIKQGHAASTQGHVEAMDAQMREASAPDAMEQRRASRQAHGEQLRSIPDQAAPQEVQPSREEQALVTEGEKALINMIHDKGRAGTHLKAIFAAQDPVAGIGNVSANMVQGLKQHMPNMTEDVLGALGQRAVEEFVELAELANPSLNLSDDDMAEAYSIGLQVYMKTNADEIDDDEVRGFLADA